MVDLDASELTTHVRSPPLTRATLARAPPQDDSLRLVLRTLEQLQALTQLTYDPAAALKAISAITQCLFALLSRSSLS